MSSLVEKSSFELSLEEKELDELVVLYKEVEKQGELYKGLILLYARGKMDSNQEFGKWRSRNFRGLPQQQANCLMNEARYFRDKPELLDKIPTSIRYAISAPINSLVADELVEKCLKYEGKLSGAVFKGMLDGYDQKKKEVVELTEGQLSARNVSRILEMANGLLPEYKVSLAKSLSEGGYNIGIKALIPDDNPPLHKALLRVMKQYYHPDKPTGDKDMFIAIDKLGKGL